MLRQATEAAPGLRRGAQQLRHPPPRNRTHRRGPRRAEARRRAPPRLRQRPHQSRQRAERVQRAGRGGDGLPQGHRPRPLRPAGAPPPGADAISPSARSIARWPPAPRRSPSTRSARTRWRPARSPSRSAAMATPASRLYDFDRFVTRISLTPPPGSGDIDTFNETLATAVREAPSLVWEPPNRVTRNGAVTQDLLAEPSPPIRRPGARAACRHRRLPGDPDGRLGEPLPRPHPPAIPAHADRLDPDRRRPAPAAHP